MTRRGSLAGLVACWLLAGAGCSPLTTPLSSDEVLQQDPGFSELLTERATITAAIQQLEASLQAERHALLQEIAERRAAVRARERAVQAQVRVLEQRLDPARDLLRATLSEAEQGLRRTEATLKGLRRTEAELTRLVQRTGLPAGQAGASSEVRQWQEQLAAIVRQIPPLEQQRTTLRHQRRLAQAQLRLLAR